MTSTLVDIVDWHNGLTSHQGNPGRDSLRAVYNLYANGRRLKEEDFRRLSAALKHELTAIPTLIHQHVRREDGEGGSRRLKVDYLYASFEPRYKNTPLATLHRLDDSQSWLFPVCESGTYTSRSSSTTARILPVLLGNEFIEQQYLRKTGAVFKFHSPETCKAIWFSLALSQSADLLYGQEGAAIAEINVKIPYSSGLLRGKIIPNQDIDTGIHQVVPHGTHVRTFPLGTESSFSHLIQIYGFIGATQLTAAEAQLHALLEKVFPQAHMPVYQQHLEAYSSRQAFGKDNDSCPEMQKVMEIVLSPLWAVATSKSAYSRCPQGLEGSAGP